MRVCSMISTGSGGASRERIDKRGIQRSRIKDGRKKQRAPAFLLVFWDGRGCLQGQNPTYFDPFDAFLFLVL